MRQSQAMSVQNEVKFIQNEIKKPITSQTAPSVASSQHFIRPKQKSFHENSQKGIRVDESRSHSNEQTKIVRFDGESLIEYFEVCETGKLQQIIRQLNMNPRVKMCGGLGICFNCRNKHVRNDQFRLDATTLDSQSKNRYDVNQKLDSNSSTQEIEMEKT